MLHLRLVVLFLLLTSQAFSQVLLDQRLFYLTNEGNPDQTGYLYYIDIFQNGQIILTDSSLYKDFSIDDDMVLATGENSVLYQIPGSLQLGLIPIDTIENTFAARGFIIPFDGQVFLRETHPFFYWKDGAGNLLTLDSTSIPSGFTDAMYYDGNMYILYPDSLRIVDLQNFGSSAVTTLATPKPFPFGGMNLWLHSLKDVNNDDHIYVVIEYYTALMRTSLIEYQPASQSFDSIFHYNTFSNYYRPLVAMGLLYMANFDTYYDPATDMIHFSNQPNWPVYHAVGFDPMNYTFYLHKPTGQKVYFADNPGSYYDSIPLGKTVSKFEYWYGVYGASAGKEAMPDDLRFFREKDGVRIITTIDDNTITGIEVYDLSGRLLEAVKTGLPAKEARVPLGDSRQISILKVSTDRGNVVRKWVN